ncbi:MAG: S41 family peptidase [Candidatus Absconditabacterales bacterium]|nr:S41 family peptidase [Candidatus Absconditabacterales bacterium]
MVARIWLFLLIVLLFFVGNIGFASQGSGSSNPQDLITRRVFMTEYFGLLQELDPMTRMTQKHRFQHDRDPVLDRALLYAVNAGLLPDVALRLHWDRPISSTFVQRLLALHHSITRQRQSVTRAVLDTILADISGRYDLFVPEYTKVGYVVSRLSKLSRSLPALPKVRTFAALVQKLDDEYASYLFADDMDVIVHGGSERGILGIMIEKHPGGLRVTDVVAGYGASEQGVQIGDIITHINGLSVFSYDNVMNVLGGEQGTFVELTLQRGDVVVTVKIRRQKQEHTLIDYTMSHDGILILVVHQFVEGMTKTVQTIIDQALAQGPINGLVISFADNPGGDLNEAIAFLSLLLPSQTPLITSTGMYTSAFLTSMQPSHLSFLSTIPVVVIQNKVSASASEIVAFMLRNRHPNTTIVGETSYGKGSIQDLIQFIDNTGFKYTVGTWYDSVTKESINKKGVVPDRTLQRYVWGDALNLALRIIRRQE